MAGKDLDPAGWAPQSEAILGLPANSPTMRSAWGRGRQDQTLWKVSGKGRDYVRLGSGVLAVLPPTTHSLGGRQPRGTEFRDRDP